MPARFASRVVCVSVALLLSIGPAACVTEGPPMARQPREIPPQPEGIIPTDLDLLGSRFAQDSDGNGYADMLHITVYLFNSVGSYRASIRAEGSLSFVLTGQDGKVISKWEFDAAQAAAARQQLLAGPGYMFKLSLRDNGGSDELATTDARLRCTFTPAGGGTPLTNRNPIAIGIGRI